MSMMIGSPAEPERTRVSILERFIPSIAFGLAALSGIVGGALTLNMFRALRQEENVGADAIVGALLEFSTTVLVLLGLSIVFGLAGVVVCAVRMLSERRKSSPPGILYLAAGVPNLISPLMIAYVWSMLINVVTDRSAGSVVDTGARELSFAAIAAGIVTILILPLFSFVPFSSRPGKKFLSLAALTLMLIATAATASTFVGLAYLLIIARGATE